MSIRQDALKETNIHKHRPCSQETSLWSFPASLARVTPEVDLITPLLAHCPFSVYISVSFLDCNLLDREITLFIFEPNT